MLDVDLALKILAIPQLHELMRVPCVTVFAAELAATVRIDHPPKRHARASALRNVTARREVEVFHLTLGFNRRAFGGETCDADQLGHASSSLFIRLLSRPATVADLLTWPVKQTLPEIRRKPDTKPWVAH
jgi:hypothetical protein